MNQLSITSAMGEKANCELRIVRSGTNNIVFATPLSDTAPNTPENIAILGWKGLKLKLQQGLDSAGQFYQQLVSTIGKSIGVADGEPYWNGSEGAVAGLG
ncbi:hypothetical protein [Nostoc flagelliforme]|nr:hypothetical protein [Nostoc flagelliforme]